MYLSQSYSRHGQVEGITPDAEGKAQKIKVKLRIDEHGTRDLAYLISISQDTQVSSSAILPN